MVLFFVLFSQWILSSSGLSPVMFLPGYSGSLLYATVTDENYIPFECQDSSLPIGIPFRVLGNLTLEKNYPHCVQRIMELQFNKETNEFVSQEGIVISTNDGYEGIAPVYWPFMKTLETWGYQTRKNSYGIPYDYRYLSMESFFGNGFISTFQSLIEQSYHLNHGSPAILIGHSNGGPTLYYFLQAMTLEWKHKYLSAIIGLSGNFLGQLNGIKTFVYSDNLITQEMLNTWEAQYNSLTWGGYTPTEVLVTTYSGTSSEKNYTTATDDIMSLLKQTQHPDWIQRYKATSSRNNRSIAPSGVDIYCLCGQGLDTSSSFVFSENILNDPPIETKYIDGDGNQDWIDNTFCDSWRSEVEHGGHILETESYAGVHHMQMYLDENVLEKIHEILNKYSSFSSSE
jgi:hypothetical protein